MALRRGVRRGGGDQGVALVMVIGLTMVAFMFVSAAVAYAVMTQKTSRRTQDWTAALAAAQAGVDDYIAHLNRNDSYGLTWDCSNVALRGPNEPGNTCGWTSATPVGWQSIAADPAGGMFHYDVDTSSLARNGTVEVTSTGKVNGVTRTLQVAVGRGGSTDFLYYTDHEDADPDNKYVYPNGMPSYCAKYWWDGRKNNNSGCQEITFVGGDVLDGPVHTNDTPLMTTYGGKKPEFKQGLETSDPKCKQAVPNNPSTYTNCDRTGNGATYGTGYPPHWAGTLDLQDNSAAFTNYPGCHYVGSTRIKFNGDGTMTVWSKDSTGAKSPGAACGGDAPNGVTVTVPNDQVIYVAGATVGAHKCRSGEIGDGLPLGTYAGSETTSYTYDQSMIYSDKYCGGPGNAYVEGVLKGRVTLAASNAVVVTGDLVLAGGLNGTDMLGLVAGNSVEVMHPMLDTWECQSWFFGCWKWGWDGHPSEVAGWPHRIGDPSRGAIYPTSGIQVAASIQTLQHSLLVQNYDKGSSKGNLLVWGSIAQRWRGIVGKTGSSSATGYFKDYRYDTRLKFSAPPYFPQWANAVWTSRHVGEISPQYH